MCGIIGCFSNEGFTGSEKRKKFAIQSIYADAVRGWDSTGMMGMEGNRVEVYKRALTASDFLPLRQSTKMIDKIDKYQYFVGHNRAATKGGVYDWTAHPFDFENLTGVHNGTLFNHRNLPGGNKFGVDSEAIFNALNDYSPDEIIPKLDGAFALVWFDKRNETLSMVRNEERPLALAYIKGLNTVLMASEIHMLQWICIRNGIAVDEYEEVKPGEIITFDHMDAQTFKTPARRSVALKEKWVAPKYPSYSERMDGFGNEVRDKDYGKGGKETKKQKKDRMMVDILAGIGSKPGELMSFVMSGFDAYPGNSGKGSVEGFIENIPYISVHCHGMDVKLYDAWNDCSDNWLCSGKIVNAFSQNDYDDAIVVKDFQVVNKKYKDGDAVGKVLVDEIPFEPGSENVILLEDRRQGLPEKEDDKVYLASDYALPKNYFGPYGTEITREKWHQLIEEGCVHCTGPIYDYENHRTSWSDDHKPVCPDCVKLLNLHAFH